jgi:hypothetical protein
MSIHGSISGTSTLLPSNHAEHTVRDSKTTDDVDHRQGQGYEGKDA